MHPKRDELKGLMLGTLIEEDADQIAGHIDQCPVCADTVRELESVPDELIRSLRRSVVQHPVEQELGCQRLLEVVEAIGIDRSSGVEAVPADDEDLRTIRDYQLVAKLGQGGMGAVYQALHRKLQKVVALKVLPANRMRDARAVERFEREMKAVGRLSHPNIVGAHDAGEHDGTSFLVMEYVDGIDLSELVHRVGPLPIADACEILRQAAIGLQHAHEQGLVHRDIKPSNLMLSKTGQVKLLDMGLALLEEYRLGEEHALTAAGQWMGTLKYMAPEHGEGSHDVDIRADIYSLGATLHKLLCGKAPFSGDKYNSRFRFLTALATEDIPSITTRRDDLPAELVAIVDRMLSKHPRDRFASPQEVADALTPLAHEADLASLLDRANNTGAQVGKDDSEVAARGQAISGSNSSEQAEAAQAVTSHPAYGGGSRKPPVLTVAGLAALFAAVITVIVLTDRGELTVVSYDPDIEVIVKRDGKVIDSFQVKQRDGPVPYSSGDYEIGVKSGIPDGVVIKNRAFTLARNKAVHVEIVHEPTTSNEDADRQAAEQIVNSGGRFKIENDERDFTGLEGLPDRFAIVQVDLTGADKKEIDRILTYELRSLQSLFIGRTAADDTTIDFVLRHQGLIWLSCGRTEITNDGIARIASETHGLRRLQGLQLDGALRLDSGCVQDLSRLTSLEKLFVHDVGFTDEDLDLLKSRLPALRDLRH